MAAIKEPDILAQAPRCGAKTRRGTSCQSPAVQGKKRCRMHGGTNPGAPKGNRNAWKHGPEFVRARGLIMAQTGLAKDEIPTAMIEAKISVLRVKKEARRLRMEARK